MSVDPWRYTTEYRVSCKTTYTCDCAVHPPGTTRTRVVGITPNPEEVIRLFEKASKEATYYAKVTDVIIEQRAITQWLPMFGDS